MPQNESPLPAPSKTDLEILAVLWDQPSATGRAIYDTLLATGRLRRQIAYTTVKTYLDRLVQKGYIHGHALEDGRGTYQYTAAVSREAVRDHPDTLARLVRVFRLTPAAFIRWCEAHGRLSPQDLAALRTLVHDLSEQTVPSQDHRSPHRRPYEPDQHAEVDVREPPPLGNP
jgi:BlaI family transcriptional regulator, penicillinase repressor